MAQDSIQGSLDLSEYIHVLSPSPDAQDGHTRESASPEPLLEADIAQMRRRLSEITVNRKEGLNYGSWEKELADMVLRLTSTSQTDSSQLIQQAELISNLKEQRDFLLQQANEERVRWDVERDGWARMAEALITCRARDDNSSMNDDSERHNALSELENRTLRDKLSNTQSRLASLEAELSRLRPLLLMQPYTLAPPNIHQPYNTTNHRPHPFQTLQNQPPKRHYRKRKPNPKGEGAATPREDSEASEEDAEEPPEDPDNTPASKSSSSKLKAVPPVVYSGYYRKPPEQQPPLPKSFVKKPRLFPPTPLLSDARAEHLLLAARKIGRERAGLMTSMLQLDVRQRELEQERQRLRDPPPLPPIHTQSHYPPQHPTSHGSPPKTPKRTLAPVGPQSSHPHSHYQSHTTPNYNMYHNAGLAPSPGSLLRPMTLPQASAGAGPSGYEQQTPSRSARAALGTGRTNPPTPLDSLLSAAKMMDSRGGDDSDEEGVSAGPAAGPAWSRTPGRTRAANGRMTTRASTGASAGAGTSGASSSSTRMRPASVMLDMPESPVPIKRRRVGGAQRPGGSPGQGATPRSLLEKLSGGGARVKSALDVLADQAAVFSSQGVSVKGKEREMEREMEGLGEGGTPRRASGDSKIGGEKDVVGELERNTARGRVGAKAKGKSKDVESEPQREPQPGAISTEDNPFLDSSKKSLPQPPESPTPGPRQRGTTNGHSESTPAVAEAGLPISSASAMDVEMVNSDWGGEGVIPIVDSGQQMQGTPLVLERASIEIYSPSTPRALSLPIQSTTNPTSPSSPSPADIAPTAPTTPPIASSSSSTIVLAPPVTLSRSHSEGRDYPDSHSYTEPEPSTARRATSIPIGSVATNPTDIGSASAGNSFQHYNARTDGEQQLMDSEVVDFGMGMGVFDSNTGVFDSFDMGLGGEGGALRNQDLARVGGQEMQMVMPGKRPRSPYVKWSQEEDDLLAQAVAKYGPKWDLVQKALPSRGYHQVRQRWLRKLGVFDSKPDLSSFQTAGFPPTSGSVSRVGNGESTAGDPPPQPKLGLAPLSSELAFSGFGRTPGSGARSGS